MMMIFLAGNGDILSYEDANLRREQTGVTGLMIARGALIKPWVFTGTQYSVAGCHDLSLTRN